MNSIVAIVQASQALLWWIAPLVTWQASKSWIIGLRSSSGTTESLFSSSSMAMLRTTTRQYTMPVSNYIAVGAPATNQASIKKVVLS